MKIQSAVKWQRMPKNQSLKIGRKTPRFGHRCVIDQHRNDRNTALERVSDFQTNKIVRVIYSAKCVGLFAEPMRADHGDNDIGAFDCVVDLLAKIQSWLD